MERIIIDQERLFDIYALDDHGFDPISMYILLNHLPEDYKPSGKTLAMVIGHSAQKYDGVLIRTLHQHRSGINKKDLAVVACDISEREPEDLTPEVYNLEIFGERRGNAAKFAPWSIGLNAAEGRKDYDFILIHNPDFVDVEDYIEIFRKAHSFLSPNGVIAAISAESTTDSGRKEPYGDVARLESLCKRLTEEAGILFSCRYHFVSEGNHQFDYGFACIQKTL